MFYPPSCWAGNPFMLCHNCDRVATVFRAGWPLNLPRKGPGRRASSRIKKAVPSGDSFHDAVRTENASSPSRESIPRLGPTHCTAAGPRLGPFSTSRICHPQSFSSDARRSFHARYYTWFDGEKHAPKTPRSSSHLVVS